MREEYLKYALKTLEELVMIPSPSGFTDNITDYLIKELTDLGYAPKRMNKGGVAVELGGDEGEGLLLGCHVDTLGGMVEKIKDDGRLKIAPLGFLSPNNIEDINVMIYTHSGKEYEGTCHMEMPSWHINTNYETTPRTFENMEIVIDQHVKSADDTRALGIEVGDVICFDPQFRITESGYIKSRHLDDKLSACVILALAKYLKEEKPSLKRKVYAHFTVYEEVDHGASAYCPADVAEFLAVDMACVGPQYRGDEHMVSICAKDNAGPCSFSMVSALQATARSLNLECTTEVFPNYASDADIIVKAGYDVRHCTVGPGVYASHGYERSHIDGLKNTFKMVKGYMER